jgi:peptidyl-prolyl isomerase D
MEKIQKANAYKEQGNEFFQQNDIDQAMVQYHFGILEVKAILSQQQPNMKSLIPQHSLLSVSPAQLDEAKLLLVLLSSNLSMCHLKQGRINRAIKASTDALDVDPNHSKSLYRRARAYMEASEWRDLEKARRDLEEAKKSAPNDKAIETLLVQLAKLEKIEDQKLKSQYAKMFD